jgi:hypothetical protein
MKNNVFAIIALAIIVARAIIYRCSGKGFYQ